ncbi:glycosyltransferase [Aureimonas fodinaquatilis]|uniref:Glycosyltransferase n=1 Tax=Aureimonas fodinaquatilis TaxID=2565783 RepID=A0A5B0DZE6_9HYPH|nr:glycosyltransferase [Aureimonas fodinaquatilis]KAA0970579.1 glycosyltransferase [Aureimonas fodinaquatilis]
MPYSTNQTQTRHSGIGVVIIGRNEGARLVACLASLGELAPTSAYVDSGSTDNSTANANGAGVQVVNLDMSAPFTAARARNAGYKALQQKFPALQYVQFVDGDCELASGWVESAANFLDANPKVAIVAGRRRERFPQATIYNAMTDREWSVPAGEKEECGGDFLIRTEAFSAANGFNPALIAGEEPELCVRLRAAGWQVHRIDHEMTRHDAAMTRFGQWWKRNVRAGHAFAEVSRMHRDTPTGIWRRNVRGAVLWAGIIPAIVLAITLLVHPAGLLLLGVYPAQIARMAMRAGASRPENWQHSAFLVLGKFPELQGILQYEWNRLTGKRQRLIEYK